LGEFREKGWSARISVSAVLERMLKKRREAVTAERVRMESCQTDAEGMTDFTIPRKIEQPDQFEHKKQFS